MLNPPSSFFTSATKSTVKSKLDSDPEPVLKKEEVNHHVYELV